MDISKKYLIEYYNSLQDECISYASKIDRKYKKVDIHNFRVAVKKMNAFKSFIKFIHSEFDTEGKELEKIYKSAGRLRTLTLLKKDIKDLKLYDKQWKKYFRDSFKKEKEKYSRIYSEFEKIKGKFRRQTDKIFLILDEANKLEETSGEYLRSLYSSIKKNSDNNSQASFHDVRKLMKELGYNYSLLSEAFYFLTDEMLITEINNLSKILGKWHDRVVLRKFIMRKKNFEGGDRLAEQVQMDIKKDEDYIYNSLNAFMMRLKELNF